MNLYEYVHDEEKMDDWLHCDEHPERAFIKWFRVETCLLEEWYEQVDPGESVQEGESRWTGLQLVEGDGTVIPIDFWN